MRKKKCEIVCNLTKRILAIVLAAAEALLLGGMFGALPANAASLPNPTSCATSVQEVQRRLSEIEAIFPMNSHFTTDGTACTHASDASCSNCEYRNVMRSLGMTVPSGYSSAHTCLGFIKFVYYYLFDGSEFLSANTDHVTIATKETADTAFNNALPGDVVYWFNANGAQVHYSIYLSGTGTNAVMYDANNGWNRPSNVGEVSRVSIQRINQMGLSGYHFTVYRNKSYYEANGTPTDPIVFWGISDPNNGSLGIDENSTPTLSGSVKFWFKKLNTDTNYYINMSIDGNEVINHGSTDPSGYISYVCDTSSLSNGTHNISAMLAWTTGGFTATKQFIVSNAIDSSPPVISNVQISNITATSYTVSCTVTDNITVNRVQFPTWTTYNGQDDLASNWTTNTQVTGTNIGNNTYTYVVNKSDHNNEEGPYVTHIYAFDNAGNSAVNTSLASSGVKLASYTVSFNANGGSVNPASVAVLWNKTCGTLPTPVYEGYTFLNWYTDSACTAAFNPAQAITSNLTLYAGWKANSCTVTFQTNGGSAVASQTVKTGEPATEPAAPTRSGYTFAGWFSDENCTSAFSFATAIHQNTTLYADWNQIPTTAINETNFPDPYFRAYVQKNCDTNGDGAIDETEALSVTAIDCSSAHYWDSTVIKDLTGIQIFRNLVNLNCSNNAITVLDASSLTKLTSLNCNQNEITSLTLTNLTNLTALQCGSNPLTTIDLSACTGLTYLYSANCSLTAVDVSHNANLIELNVFGNNITSIDTSHNAGLNALQISNNKISAIDVSGNRNLTSISCENNNLSALNVSALANLQFLYCQNNKIAALNISGCRALSTVDCSGNQLTTLNANDLAALTRLNCSSNALQTLNLANSSKLCALQCAKNELKNISLQDCAPEFLLLDCSNNNLESLDVSFAPKLYQLDCSYNNIANPPAETDYYKAETSTYKKWVVAPQKKGFGDVYGTINAVDVQDLMYLANIVAAKTALSTEETAQCDLNGDGAVDVADVAILAKYLVNQ